MVRAQVLTAAAILLISFGSARAEQTLQSVFDGFFVPGCVNAGLDTGTQTFPSGTYDFTLITRITTIPNARLDWYPVGAPDERCEIFSESDPDGRMGSATIPVPFGLRLTVFPSYSWESEVILNADGFRHFQTFAICGQPSGIALGFEDGTNGGDQDFQDYVFALNRTGNAPAQCGGTPIAKGQLSTFVPDGTGGGIALLGQSMQRIGADGLRDPTWPSDGVRFSTDASVTQDAAGDGAGGGFAAWATLDLQSDGGPPSQMLIEHVTSQGQLAWPDPLLASTSNGQKYGVSTTADGVGGMYIFWAEQDPNSLLLDIRGTHVNSNGATVAGWPSSGLKVSTGLVDESTFCVPDGTGGAIVVWVADSSGVGTAGIRAQRLSASGSSVWVPGGIVVRDLGALIQPPRIAPDGAGGFIAAWADFRSGAFADMYAQHVASDGSMLWVTNGVPACQAPNEQEFPAICPDESGGAVIAWQDSRSSLAVYAQALNATGAPRWAVDGIQVSGLGGTSPTLKFGSGILTVAWTDNFENAAYDFLTLDGNRVYPPEGHRICDINASGQGFPRLVQQGGRNALIAWIASVGCLQKSFAAHLDVLSPPTTAVELVLLSAEATDSRVHLVWSGPHASVLTATVSRREDGADWREVGSAESVGSRFEFDDTTVTPAARYTYRLVIQLDSGREIVDETSVEVPTSPSPKFSLLAPRPNPTAGISHLAWTLPHAGQVRITVFDLQGGVVRRITDRAELAGFHAIEWDGRNETGERVGSGVYWVKAESDRLSAVRRITLVR